MLQLDLLVQFLVYLVSFLLDFEQVLRNMRFTVQLRVVAAHLLPEVLLLQLLLPSELVVGGLGSLARRLVVGVSPVICARKIFCPLCGRFDERIYQLLPLLVGGDRVRLVLYVIVVNPLVG